MNDRERAGRLVTTIINSFDRTSSVDAIITHDNKIRMECNTTVLSKLEEALEALNGTSINLNNYNKDKVRRLNEGSTKAWWAIRDAIAAIAGKE